jgi:arsenite methyltransferase
MTGRDPFTWWPFADDEDPQPPSPSPGASGLFVSPSAVPAPSPPVAMPDPRRSAVAHEAARFFAQADPLTTVYDINAPGVAEVYDAIVVPQWSRPFGQMLINQMMVLPKSVHTRILDVACGTGYPTIEIARTVGGAEVIGLDPWRAAVELARQHANESWMQGVSLLVEDITRSSQAEGSFDIITCNLGYTSFADRSRAMAVMSRLLVPEGWLVLTTPLQTAFREFLDLFHVVLAELALVTCTDALMALVRGRPTIATTRAALERPGLVVERVMTDHATITFADARDFLTSPVIALSFLAGWRAIVPDLSLRRLVFNEIERRLNLRAAAEGGLRFNVPMLCVVARRPTPTEP